MREKSTLAGIQLSPVVQFCTGPTSYKYAEVLMSTKTVMHANKGKRQLSF